MVFKISTSRRSYAFPRTSPPRIKLFLWLMPVAALLALVGYRQLESYFAKPEAVLVLGGSGPGLEREKFAAELARQHPDMPIWVSGGGLIKDKIHTERVFAKAGIASRRVRLDYQAVDTVTNFTTLVDELQAEGIDSIYLITSDYHMRRARVIGEIVLGSRGISIKSVSVPTKNPSEPVEKSVRDGGRAIVWVATGYTGATLVKRQTGSGSN
ncbi:YdcF family protein [Microcoleus sp. FACHB-831]|nr:YdcF family protein [Microcoleus sp. FACHB-831]